MTDLTCRPTARIVANGLDITTQLMDPKETRGRGSRPLVSITVTDEAGIKSDTVELTIDNRDGRRFPPIASEIQVWLGYEPAPVFMGRFRLVRRAKSGAPNLMQLTGHAADLTTAIKEKKLRSWHETTVGGIVGAVAGEHGLGNVTDPELAARPIEHIDQQSESDLHFLSRLALRNGATFKLADGKVIFAKKGSKALPGGAAKPAVVLKPADVSSWSIEESERGGHRSAVAYYHDHARGKRVGVTVGTGSPRHLDPKLYRTRAEAEAAAKATLGDLTRGRREAQIAMPGKPEIFAEGVVRLVGFDPDADGDYFAKSVSHAFSASGFTTNVTLETEKEEADADT